MKRYDFYYLQLLSESELDAALDACEQADWDMMADHDLVGIVSGMEAAEHSPTADLTIDVPAGTAYDPDGARIRIPSLQNLDVSVDHLGASTAVSTPGSEKIVSVFVYPDRDLSDPRIDGNSITVYFQRAETFAFKVVQGSETASPPATPPALETDKILVCDLRRQNPQTQIENDDITPPGGTYTTITNRRQDVFVGSAGNFSIREGTPEEAIQALLTELNGHATDSIGSPHHASTAISAAVSATWANGGTIVGTTVDAVQEEIVTDLAGIEGYHYVGAETELSTTWENATVIDPDYETVSGMFEKIVENLAAKAAVPDCGADRIGSPAHSSGTDIPLTAGSVREQLVELANKAGGLGTANVWASSNEFDAQVDFNSTASFAGDVGTDTTSDWTWKGKLIMDGPSARQKYRRATKDVTSGDVTVDTEDGDVIAIQGTPGVTRDVLLQESTPSDLAVGERLWFRKTANNKVRFRDEADSTTLAETPADGTKQHAAFQWNGTFWEPIAWSSGMTNIS